MHPALPDVAGGTSNAPLHTIYRPLTDPAARFGDTRWGTGFHAIAFLQSHPDLLPAIGTGDPFGVAAPDLAPAKLDAELRELVELMPYRPAAMAEAVSQAPSFVDWFRGLMPYTASSHPRTHLLVAIVLEAATRIGMGYKMKFGRARPSQLSPALMPPIDPPAHASYPSGHATQSMALAGLFTAIHGEAVGTLHPAKADGSVLTSAELRLPEEQPDPATAGSGTGDDPAALVLRNPFIDLAVRIGRNREVLGLHYPSDSKAGRALGRAIWNHLARHAAFAAIVAEAREEWRAERS